LISESKLWLIFLLLRSISPRNEPEVFFITYCKYNHFNPHVYARKINSIPKRFLMLGEKKHQYPECLFAKLPNSKTGLGKNLLQLRLILLIHLQVFLQKKEA
jgi:hypothetical protein